MSEIAVMPTAHRLHSDDRALVQERWHILPNNRNYPVSDHGRVMGITAGRGAEIGRILKHASSKNGYPRVELFSRGRPTGRYNHRIVVETFIGDIPAGNGINHINGVKADNRIENLEVVTHAQNTKHAWGNGRMTVRLAA